MSKRLALPSILLMIAAPAGIAQFSHREVSGLQVADGFGAAVAFAGDADADGVTDIVVGAPHADLPASDAGYVAIVSGSSGLVLHTFQGVVPSQDVGLSVAPVYDVDGDGHDDIAAYTGAPVVGPQQFIVTVFSGATGQVLRVHDGTALGAAAFGVVPPSLDPAGDVDADGSIDYIIGAFAAQQFPGFLPGAALVFSGPSGVLLKKLYGDDPAESFGWSVAAAGDLDADGFDDVAVGAPIDEEQVTFPFKGSVSVFSGATWNRIRLIYGNAAFLEFGRDIDSVGDVNGDTIPDLAVGTASNSAGSRVQVYSGAANSLLLTEITGTPNIAFGYHVASAGDQNGDGRDDVLISARYSSVTALQSGAAYLYSVSPVGPLRTFHGAAPGQQYGAHIDGGGDTNGDGAPDLLVGAPFANAATTGKAHLFESACQTLYAYGDGCQGTGGFVPSLDVSGCVPATGSGPLTLSITQGYGGKTWLLFAGVQPAYFAQPSGCNLLLVPVLAPASVHTLLGSGPGAGTYSSTFTLSASQLPLDIFLQAFTLDPKPLGYAATNGFVIGKPGT